MSRKEILTPNELAICQRLRDFRKGTLIPRAVFALSVGVTSDRLSTVENERSPVRFDLFSAIHREYFVSPMWLVEGKGIKAYNGPLALPDADRLYPPRALLSECYANGLKKTARDYRSDLFFSLAAPDGLSSRIEEYIDLFKRPGVLDGFNPQDVSSGVAKIEELLIVLRSWQSRAVSH